MSSPIQRAKDKMAYQAAGQRPSCRNCYHSEQAGDAIVHSGFYPWRCAKGGFGTTAQAVCAEHQPFQKGGRHA